MEGRAAWRTDMDERNKQLKQQQEQAAWLKQQMEERAKQKADSQAKRQAEDAEGNWGGGRQVTNHQAASSVVAESAPEPKQPPQQIAHQPTVPRENPVGIDDEEESIFALPSKPQQINLPGLGGIPLPVSLDVEEPKQEGALPSKRTGLGAGKGSNAAPRLPAASRGRGGSRPVAAAAARGGSARPGRGAQSCAPAGRGDNANGVQANGHGAARSARPRVSSAPGTDCSASSLREQLAFRDAELRELRTQLQRQQQTIEQQAAEIAQLRASNAQPQPQARSSQSHAAQPSTRHGASDDAPDELQRLVGSVFKTEGAAHVAQAAAPSAGAVPGSKAAAKRAEAAAAAAASATSGNGSGQDHFLSATKACVRADSTRCGSIDAADLFRLCAQYKVEIPPEKAEAAKKKGRVAYTKFIDELRVLPAAAG